MKKISVQETLMRETEIEVPDAVYEGMSSNNPKVRKAAQDEAFRLFEQATTKEKDAEKLEWVQTTFIGSDDEDLWTID